MWSSYNLKYVSIVTCGSDPRECTSRYVCVETLYVKQPVLVLVGFVEAFVVGGGLNIAASIR